MVDYLPCQDRYEDLLIMVREGRNLKLLKRAGRGHGPRGVDETKEGECAVVCPACPYPSRNLLESWEDTPKPIR